MQPVKAVIFDLDGVIVSTDEFHFRAWKTLADHQEIPFDREDNERLRGVSRMESLEIILEKSPATFSNSEKEKMAEVKNAVYQETLKRLSPTDILPGVMETLEGLMSRGIKVAIGSSSKNAAAILGAIGLADVFDTVVDGTHISRSKPDPEVFTLASKRLGIPPDHCLVVEDADSGVAAALAAGMRVLAVGPARVHPDATLRAEDLASIPVEEMLFVKEASQGPLVRAY